MVCPLRHVIFEEKRGKNMATDQLRAAYEAAEKLSLKYQDLIAEKILEEIEEAKWEEWLALPETEKKLSELEAKAKAQHLAGETKKYVPGKSLAELFQ
jgi:hypothetical protein